uniref:Uncharacterized protein n=1 Tax=Utricularia reniformis TaxID=192314 RepID=A0A1Y0AYW9_9LAMI|nr:hypothetical protein AEK19_MT1122 [Utricularia reniformis]ART30351.1 hypothetical protein AEK19_MT1122 [Utricularia reniformis]
MVEVISGRVELLLCLLNEWFHLFYHLNENGRLNNNELPSLVGAISPFPPAIPIVIGFRCTVSRRKSEKEEMAASFFLSFFIILESLVACKAKARIFP